jgi:TROVE domain
MPKFNKPRVQTPVRSPITSTKGVTASQRPKGHTYEGAPGYKREKKSELYLLAVTNMVGERTFYEDADDRDERFEELVHRLAVDDPDWILQFITWLRLGATMRTASIVAAAEGVKARLAAAKVGDLDPARSGAGTAFDSGWNRKFIDAACQRGDEPGELLAYWTTRHGRAIPKPVKRGLADAARRLYTERSLIKYDAASKGFHFGDVVDLVHPSPADDRTRWQGDLFQHALDRRHHRGNAIPETLCTLQRNRDIMAIPVEQRRDYLRSLTGSGPDAPGNVLRAAGMTWEQLAGWLQGPMDKMAWEAIIPSMGLLGLLRNLRNFDEAGVSDQAATAVAARLASASQIAGSRILPFRFLSAYRAAPSLRWAWPLEQALGHSLANVPALAGRTLILVDTSGSMDAPFSKDGTLMRWDAAALFGIALGHRCAAADVVSFSSLAYFTNERGGANVKAFPLNAGESVLRSLQKWKDGGWFLGGGTETAAALRATFNGHDRVVILTDEQAAHDGTQVTESIPASVPLYTWNLAGYKKGHAPSGSHNRHTFGGLTDQAFAMIPLLELGRDGAWPWETA